jgi:hypothetical protein
MMGIYAITHIQSAMDSRKEISAKAWATRRKEKAS